MIPYYLHWRDYKTIYEEPNLKIPIYTWYGWDTRLTPFCQLSQATFEAVFVPVQCVELPEIRKIYLNVDYHVNRIISLLPA